MTIIHLIDTYTKLNFGVWNAAIFASDYLQNVESLNTEIWYCNGDIKENETGCKLIRIPKEYQNKSTFPNFLERNISSKSTIIFVSHGCWRKPTFLGYWAKSLGHIWITTPHGMLEPWSLKNKLLKKIIYFFLIEKRLLNKANALRAVSKNEFLNLRKIFTKKIYVIANGVDIKENFQNNFKNPELTFLFMARLHSKKGVLPLVEAWASIKNKQNCKLLIAGPDEGELIKISKYFNTNCEYVGAKYGTEKEELLTKTHYYILPSLSEGFPTSVLEAMSYGCIPIITKDCNFPEVFLNNLGYEIESSKSSIKKTLTELISTPFNYQLSISNHKFILSSYSKLAIGKALQEMYKNVLLENE